LSRFYSISQIEYCRNFIFKRHFPIHKIFERSCEIGLWRLTANRISEIFGVRLNKRLNGKLATVIDQIEHGQHIFRAYWRHAFLKQYEKFSLYLRNELLGMEAAPVTLVAAQGAGTLIEPSKDEVGKGNLEKWALNTLGIVVPRFQTRQ